MFFDNCTLRRGSQTQITWIVKYSAKCVFYVHWFRDDLGWSRESPCSTVWDSASISGRKKRDDACNFTALQRLLTHTPNCSIFHAKPVNFFITAKSFKRFNIYLFTVHERWWTFAVKGEKRGLMVTQKRKVTTCYWHTRTRPPTNQLSCEKLNWN